MEKRDQPAPLLSWREDREIGMLHVKRSRLAERINKLRPRSNRRIELEAQLRELTAEQLRLEGAKAQP